jgi:hypothetical protein
LRAAPWDDRVAPRAGRRRRSIRPPGPARGGEGSNDWWGKTPGRAGQWWSGALRSGLTAHEDGTRARQMEGKRKTNRFSYQVVGGKYISSQSSWKSFVLEEN